MNKDVLQVDTGLSMRSALSRRALLRSAGAAGLMTAAAPYARAAAGQITVYSTNVPPLQKQLADAFTKKTGIGVQSLRLVTSALAQRFLAEQKAGQHVCDVVTLGSDVFFRQISDANLLDDIDDIPAVSSLPKAWRPGKQFVTIITAPESILYNSKIVTGSSIPTQWTDLTKPEFQNQIVMPDPRLNDILVPFLVTLQVALGDDFLRKLGAQKLRLVPAAQQGTEQVIAGEAKIMLPALAMSLIEYEGTSAPIAISPTPSPTNAQYFYSGIAKSAPNPAGARAWYEYVLSEEGQEILCKGKAVSPLGPIPGSLRAPESIVDYDLKESLPKADHIYDLLNLPA